MFYMAENIFLVWQLSFQERYIYKVIKKSWAVLRLAGIKVSIAKCWLEIWGLDCNYFPKYPAICYLILVYRIWPEAWNGPYRNGSGMKCILKTLNLIIQKRFQSTETALQGRHLSLLHDHMQFRSSEKTA